MDPTHLQTLVSFVFPALFGTTLIALSALTCRIRRHHQQLINLELRMGTLEVGPPRLTPSAPVPLPVYQSPVSPAPSAPPAADPLPLTHMALTVPTYQVVQAAQAQGPRYTGYI
jgi:hypothetical protein